MAFPQWKEVIEKLWEPEPGEESPDWSVYAVLDGARNELIYPAVHQSGCEFECLYLGELDQELAEAAPYLVKLEKKDPFTEWLVQEGWGNSWGVFVRRAITIRNLKRHLRKFLMVYADDYKPLYFRYYDPRVLRAYIETCSTEELEELCPRLSLLMMEGARADGMVTLRGSAITFCTLPLTRAPTEKEYGWVTSGKLDCRE